MNRQRPAIAIPGQADLPDDLARMAEVADAARAHAKALLEQLYAAALSGCVAADVARAMANRAGDEPLKLQAGLMAELAAAYAADGFRRLTGQVQQEQKAG